MTNHPGGTSERRARGRRPIGSIGRLARASGVLIVTCAYLWHVFRVSDGRVWDTGLGDWIDPYFINALLEHLYRTASGQEALASPPMYYPVPKTLGYSHGLLLYTPFYVPIRPFVHPFVAHTLTLFAVMATGIVCLYALLRKVGLSFVESLLFAAFFFTSENVVNRLTGLWSQRASVFLIPPILLLLFVSVRRRADPVGLVLAGLGGLLATLMYAQDFYTAHFAMAFAMLGVLAAACVDGELARTMRACWKAQSRTSRVILAIVAMAGAWTWYVWKFGGVEVYVWGLKVASHAWRRPAWIALLAIIVVAWLNRGVLGRVRVPAPDRWLTTFGLGAATGAVVFLWIYLGAFLEYRGFADEELQRALAAPDPARWNGLLDFVRDLTAYETLRSFVLVCILGILAWVPAFGIERRVRQYWLWLLAVSAIVVLVPLRFGDVSIWNVVLRDLPGFGVIRDPKRIIHLYELGAVVAAGWLLSRIHSKAFRASAVGLVVLLSAADWNREAFEYARPIHVYARWVAAPIDIDPACRSFYIKGASNEYMARSDHKWTLYNVDAMFVALDHAMPTLNGYSAWFPEGWSLANPQETDYAERVTRWIDRHRLIGVCELDIEARVMRPRRP